MKALIRVMFCLTVAFTGLSAQAAPYSLDANRLSLPAVQASVRDVDPDDVGCLCECVGDTMQCRPAGCSTMDGNKCPITSPQPLAPKSLFRDYIQPKPLTNFDPRRQLR